MEWSEVHRWIGLSQRVFAKKLATNDSSWADDRRKHQYGPYVPVALQAEEFFPPLKNINPSKPHILEGTIETIWPNTGERKECALHHFSNKGSEFHLTRVPKSEFVALTPASLLIGGKLKAQSAGADYWFATLDSESQECEQFESLYELSVDFKWALFEPRVGTIRGANEDELVDLLYAAYAAGGLASFIANNALPTPDELAASAQSEWLRKNSREKLDPYAIECPGDVLMTVSRDIEYSIYKAAERRAHVAKVLNSLALHGAARSERNLVESVVRGFAELDAIFLSASQHRKSRAGLSFEKHISRLLTDGGVPFTAQALTGGRRPDFVMPSVKVLRSTKRKRDEALILSAKTTLRERWKQVSLERLGCPVYLGTVDDRLSSQAILDMAELEITLVVPESLKHAKETCYSAHENVITFREFFDDRVLCGTRAFAMHPPE